MLMCTCTVGISYLTDKEHKTKTDLIVQGDGSNVEITFHFMYYV